MGKPFFTKKQKAQMRERRKKKQAAKQRSEQVEIEESSLEVVNGVQKLNGVVDDGATNHPVSNKKRVRDQDNEQCSDLPPVKKHSVTLTTRTINGKLHVVLPSELSTKDAKKYRKDARRQLRVEGKDDSTLEFVSANELPRSKKKNFPCIKELIQEKKELEEARKQEEKINQKTQQISDDVKAKYLALDCEMVGIGSDGKKSALARVSLVDWDGNVAIDTFVKVPIRVTDFRTHVSGVEPKHIKKDAMDVKKCRDAVTALIKDKIVVGHALTNDFKALMLAHPKAQIRDTAKYRPFQRFANAKWRARKLRDLVRENLKGKEGFQEGEHDSVADARATMELFQLVRNQWEKEIASAGSK